MKPLYIAFVWHMHQPWYKDPETNEYILPWVRLHSLKSYYPMIKLAQQFEASVTFNLVPSLIKQIEEYVAGKAKEGPLTRSMFEDIPERLKTEQYKKIVTKQKLSQKDRLNLAILFELAWFHPLDLDNELKEIAKKKQFTNEDMELIKQKEASIMREIIPNYKDAQAHGNVEITTSPYYHPIVPLLCDTFVVRGMHTLPKRRFRHPEDARKQIKRALNFYKERFGALPNGMWPSEGAVSEEAIRIIREAGLQYALMDEEVIRRAGATNVYMPYKFDDIVVIGRDRTISDLISFTYQDWNAKDAVTDLCSRLYRIWSNNPGGLIAIILDGENSWPQYYEDGLPFLETLYHTISKEKNFKFTTISEYIRNYPPKNSLERLATGSWLGDLRRWIGKAAKNKAWDALTYVRDKVGPCEEIYIAEGSDWFWWYGDENPKAFDELFRKYLKAALSKS